MALTSFIVCQKGVTAIEYALLSAGIAAIILLIFNPTSGPFYDVIVSAKNAIITAIEDYT